MTMHGDVYQLFDSLGLYLEPTARVLFLRLQFLNLLRLEYCKPVQGRRT